MLKKKQEHTVKSQRKVPQSHLAKSTMAAPSVTWLLLPAVVLPPALKALDGAFHGLPSDFNPKIM
jgi:hypothetical protein